MGEVGDDYGDEESNKGRLFGRSMRINNVHKVLIKQ